MAKIIDVFSYNGEEQLLDLRLNILKDVVDEFIVVEAPTTFSGRSKPLYFNTDKYPNIKYHVIDENYTEEELKQAEQSPNTKGAKHWTHEFLQKESIKKALTHLKDNDVVFIGDVDEIWEDNQVQLMGSKLKLRVYSYYLNNRSNEEFWGTYVNTYGNIKDKCLNHLRSDTKFRSDDMKGWHFTSMGGLEEVRRKLNDSYTQESYNTNWVQANLEKNFKEKKDYLGRSFKFEIDESEWPEYLKNNRIKYKNLLYKELN